MLTVSALTRTSSSIAPGPRLVEDAGNGAEA
jgi:hypothetical protein